jgi:signal transduction histidine kinase
MARSSAGYKEEVNAHHLRSFLMSKQVINVAFVGGGKGCYDILHHLKFYPPVHFKPHIIGVADLNPNAIGRDHAERLGIPTTSDYRPFLQNKDLDLIIELTGEDRVLADIHKNKLASIKVLDHVGALFLWEIIAIQEEKLHLEKKVSHLDTMAAIGEISYRMTHELRNPLMIIGGLVRRMMTRIDLPHGCRKKLKHISHHVQHIEELISDICDVVRPLKPQFTLVDMSEFIGSWCKGVKTEARLSGVAVEIEMEDELPAMYIDRSLMRQALWHIFENSLDAMIDTGGTIKIKTQLCWDNLHIDFIDTGGGFREFSTSQAMQPFMTTKPGRMGLGLALCKQIIFDHGGDIEIVNEKDKGTSVNIKLPISLTRQPAKLPEF